MHQLLKPFNIETFQKLQAGLIGRTVFDLQEEQPR
jgi:hypothetical protein